MDFIMSRCIAKLSSEYDYESSDDYLHEKLVTTLSEVLDIVEYQIYIS
jgi:hypothetical protein